MATQLFLLSTPADTHLATDSIIPNEVTATSAHYPFALGTSRGSGVIATAANATETGPTTGTTCQWVSATGELEWLSPPVAADVTISGTITANVWASESNMSANVAVNVIVDVVRANVLGTRNSNTLVRVAKSTGGTELAVTTRAVNNFTVTPTSTVVNRGDRLRVRLYGDDPAAATMATGYTWNASYNGSSAAADGDSYVSFTENFSFESAPGGSVVYLTDTASAVSTASVDKEAWTSRGGTSVGATVNNVAGWTAPFQLTDTAGGTVVDWFTRPLTAFTLTGMAVANLRGSTGATASLRCEVARVEGDGTSPTVWASWCIAPTGTDHGGLTGSQVSRTAYVSGDDLAVSNGQRLRIRVYADDRSSSALTAVSITSITYNGPTPGANGDSYVTFPQTLTEYASGPFTYTKAGFGKESG